MTTSPSLPVPRGARWPELTPRPGLAVDLGSSRTRAWAPGRGVFLDVPTVTFPGVGASCPVRRGRIVDPAGTARMVARLLGRRFPRWDQPLITVTMPVLGGPACRDAVVTALQVLQPRSVRTVSAAKAVALGAHVDTSRPLLVVDVGAQLTEVALLVDGEIADAYRTELGVDDLDGDVTCRDLTREVTETVTGMLRADHTEESLDALQRGVLLAGGGALRPEIVYDLAGRLGVPVRPAPSPHTVAVRGAAIVLASAYRTPAGEAVA